MASFVSQSGAGVFGGRHCLTSISSLTVHLYRYLLLPVICLTVRDCVSVFVVCAIRFAIEQHSICVFPSLDDDADDEQ